MKYLNLHDYNEYDGAVNGHFDQKDVELLYKAMSAGDTTGAQTWDALDQSGAPLKLQSTDPTAKEVCCSSKEIAAAYANADISEYSDKVRKHFVKNILKSKDPKQDKISVVMREFYAGELHDRWGNPVKTREQALAIAFSEAEREGKK